MLMDSLGSHKAGCFGWAGAYLLKILTNTFVVSHLSSFFSRLSSQERMVQITRQKQGGLGLSIKGGAEHKLPILISRIYKDQAADITGQLFVGDAIIKVNGEYITACPHDDAVNILRNAGDIVVLTVKHYRAATPFLQKQRKFVLDMPRDPSPTRSSSPSRSD